MLLFVGHVCVRFVCGVAFGEIILKCLIVGFRVHDRICVFEGIFVTALRDVLWGLCVSAVRYRMYLVVT